MSATALRIAVLGLSAAVTVIAFTGTANSAHDAASASRIVFHSRLKGGNNEIFTINANGTALTRLTRSAASDSNPTWSPDGRRVASSPTGTATGAATRTRTCS
jgi:Tol biopolymer transport system component